MSTAGAALWNGLLWSLGHPAATPALYAPLRIERSTRDISNELFLDCDLDRDERRRVSALFAHEIDRLRDVQILFVPALFSDSRLALTQRGLSPYLGPTLRHLRALGLQVSIAKIDTAASVAANAATVANEILASERPVWLVTHSKGGLDALHALISVPETRHKLRGWFAFQAPFFGSPVADVACGSPRANAISNAALKLLGGVVEAVSDLCTKERLRYMDEHADSIEALSAQIHIVSVATKLDGEGTWYSRLARHVPTTAWMSRLGLSNDGLVSVQSAILPNTQFLVLGGMVHGEPALGGGLRSRHLDGTTLLKALFIRSLRSHTPGRGGPQ